MDDAAPPAPSVECAPPPFADVEDRRYHGAVARLTAGVSPVALSQAWLDWSLHLVTSPGRMSQLAREAAEAVVESWMSPSPVEAADPRFRDSSWRTWPFSAWASCFQACERWWGSATSDLPGVEERHQKLAAFAARQLLDLVSPSNNLWTNPEALARAMATGGASLAQGAVNFADDVAAVLGTSPATGFEVGKDVAATPGKVVLRTPLAEVIQYGPTTAAVRPEPVVIVPAWIMKYYILDLTPAESLVRALVAEGFTVFMVSWKNPGAEDRDRGFEDYRKLGVMAALDAACTITGSPKAHMVGYCLGGTLLQMAAAAMARDGDDRAASLTLLASQADFTEAGELSLFISEAQVSLLEDLMWDRGYLRPEQMAGTFQLLKANDLIWSRLVHEYLMGEARTVQALDAWSQDATRLPYRMQSQNLRSLYLRNDLAEGRFCVGGRPVALRDMRAPMFVLATETDHIAPWRSVYKLLLLSETDITFVLTDHGHNVGVIAAPGGVARRYRLRRQQALGAYVDPAAWFASAQVRSGSWWPAWFAWLAQNSGEPVSPPPLGKATAGYGVICDAPGDYVRRR